MHWITKLVANARWRGAGSAKMVKFAAADPLPKGFFRRSFSRVRSPPWERMPRTPCLSSGTVDFSDRLDKKCESCEARDLSKCWRLKKSFRHERSLGRTGSTPEWRRLLSRMGPSFEDRWSSSRPCAAARAVRSPGCKPMPRTPCRSWGTVVSDPLDKKPERSELRALSKLLKFKKNLRDSCSPRRAGLTPK